MTEKQFRDNYVKRFLKNMDNCYHFVKEAASIRGVADIVGCCKGMPFHLELKKNNQEARKHVGRIVLQKCNIRLCLEAGAFSCLLTPETFDDFCIKFMAAVTISDAKQREEYIKNSLDDDLLIISE